MIVLLGDQVIKDLTDWTKDNLKLVKKFFELVSDIQKHPFKGIGKPEPLKHQFKDAGRDG